MKSITNCSVLDEAKNKPLSELTLDTVLRLKERTWHITFAESCTGGSVCAALVGVPDASCVLDASFVTYANDAKVRLLGVSENSIESFGVVSETVAAEMAEGAARANSAEVAVAVSGIAGPGGGSEKKPVGCVCFGYYINSETYTETVYFGDLGRNAVREATTVHAYRRLYSLIRK